MQMPSAFYGVPSFLAITIACFAVVVVIGLARGGWGRRGSTGAPVPRSAQGNNMLQTIAAILGIVSFVIQILQWLKIM
jgi:hypothetical protein